MLPVHHRKVISTSGREITDFSICFFYVTADKAVLITRTLTGTVPISDDLFTTDTVPFIQIAYLDFDKNGIKEVWLMDCTDDGFTIVVCENGSIKYQDVITSSRYLELVFAEEDGELKVIPSRGDKEKHIFSIRDGKLVITKLIYNE